MSWLILYANVRALSPSTKPYPSGRIISVSFNQLTIRAFDGHGWNGNSTTFLIEPSTQLRLNGQVVDVDSLGRLLKTEALFADVRARGGWGRRVASAIEAVSQNDPYGMSSTRDFDVDRP